MRMLILSLLVVAVGCATTTPADFRPLAAAVLALQPIETPPSFVPSQRVETPAAPRVQCLVFSTNPCPPCELLKQDIQQTLPQLGWRIGAGVDQTIRLIDTTQPVGKELADRYRVTLFPTLVILADNREVDRIIGRISAVELSWRVKKHNLPGG